ncbi:unnamed protein product [Ranitomeya imitator]|uniref:Cytochrome P450 n=1 Tax=Ranitomeya imitator TaxID=111125 RepID=A0ABN9MEM4_9NEOB|nr:unnamed protein product [Ranitomeya imitator]
MNPMNPPSLEASCHKGLLWKTSPQDRVSGNPFNNLKCVNAAVANIIVAILPNQRFDYEDPTILKLVSLINENIRLFGMPLVKIKKKNKLTNPILSMLTTVGARIPLLIHWMPGAHKKMMANIREFHSFLEATFKKKQRKELDVNDQRNLVDSFLVRQQEGNRRNWTPKVIQLTGIEIGRHVAFGEPLMCLNSENPPQGTQESTQYFHDKNLIALVDNLFVAGLDTTSTTIQWGLLLMMKYPEIQEKVQNEIEAVIGSSQPQIERRTKMPYTNAVIHEVQRFGDIAPSIGSHVASHDVTFRGYFLPEGTIVMPLIHFVFKGKAYFEKS